MTTGIAGAGGFVRLGGEFEIARLGFGTVPLCKLWPAQRAVVPKLLRRAVELGITFIDTADIYGSGVVETQIADALYPYPAGLRVATKGGMAPRRPDGRVGVDCRPERLRQRCEESLARLGVACIDLYQLHVSDPNVPWAEQVGALRDLRDAGKIRHIGVSNVTLAQLVAARSIVDIAAVQNRYGLTFRQDADVVAYCTANHIVYIAHSPLGRAALPAHTELERIARTHDATAVQIALAWVLAASPLAVVIPGTVRLEHLEDNARAAAIRLDPAEFASLAL